MQQEQWAVVGGGLLGAATANELSKYGRKVTLFESASSLGGLASAWQIGGVTWDRHYHVTLLSDLATRGLLREIDLEESMCWKKTQTGFYQGGRLFPFSNALDFLRFPLLSLPEKVRLGATIFYGSRQKNWQKLGGLTVEQWLSRLSGTAVFEKIWLPLLKAKLGDDYATTSATFIWATIQRLYAARQSGIKEELFGYLPGGYGRMLSKFDERLRSAGVDVKLNTQIAEIVPEQDGTLRVGLSSGESSCFSRVIVTTPAPITVSLCQRLQSQELASWTATPYLGVICASALLKRPLSPYYVTNILDASIPFTGLIEMSALVDTAEFGDHHLIYIPRYLRPEHPDFERTDAELESEMKAALKRMHPSLTDDDFVAFQISRARYVFPRPVAGPIREVPSFFTSVRGLHIVNSLQIPNGTLNVNETVMLAQRAAGEIHASAN